MTVDRHEAIFITGLTVFSVLSSFVIVYYAMGILTAQTAAAWNKNFAYVAAGYGLGNVYILSAAWRTGAVWTSRANGLIACCFFGVFLVDVVRGGDIGPGLVRAIVLAAVLWVNWLAIQRLCRRAARRDAADTPASSVAGWRKAPRSGSGRAGRRR